MLSEGDLDKNNGLKRLLDTDKHSINPSLLAVKFIISSIDVLHSFSITAAGVKVDAVTGRLNDITIFIAREGILVGQCSELCGSGHYGMPIVLECL
jgi:heme/copper-type cytochrome/quinol oxidase subunit 2